METERLILRPPRRADIAELFEFLGDPVAMQHTHSDKTLRECQRRVMVHEWRRRRDGCAPWVVVRREDGRIIGWGGLYEDPFELAEVWAMAHPDNGGSQRVLQKAGFVFARHLPERNRLLFRRQRPVS